jgi:hypothetical protein
MKRIRIDTELLMEKADVFRATAGEFGRAGDEVFSIAVGMPSYEGRLLKPALAAGYEIINQCRDLQRALESDAQRLQDAALAFEDVDNQTITAFTESLAQIAGSPLIAKGEKPPGLAAMNPAAGSAPLDDMELGDQGGTANFGYLKVGTRFIYLFYQGRTLVVDLEAIDLVTAEQVRSFIDAVKDWDSALSEFTKDDVEEVIAVLQEFFFGAGAFVTIPIFSILGAIAAGGAWGKMFVDAGKWTVDFEEDWNALWDARSKAADIFSELESSAPDGILSRPTTREEENLFVDTEGDR